MKSILFRKTTFKKLPFYALFCLLFANTGCEEKKTSTKEEVVNTETPANSTATATTSQNSTLTDAEKAEGWVLLFNGENLEGWRGFKKSNSDPTGWQVENGVLMTKGGNGDIISKEQYEDFELEFEWKIAPKGNSGVMYRVVERDNKNTYESGPEYQIIDNENYPDKLTEKQKTGANYDIDAPKQNVAKPAGEFNHSRIVINNGRVEHLLNGTKVVEYQLGSNDWKQKIKNSKFGTMKDYGQAEKGHIALQDHGDSVWFKNMRIRPL